MSTYDDYIAYERSPKGRARRRNWMKARVIGGIPFSQPDIMTQEEGNILKSIHILRDKLLEKWDENSTKLGMKVKKKKDEIK